MMVIVDRDLNNNKIWVLLLRWTGHLSTYFLYEACTRDLHSRPSTGKAVKKNQKAILHET